jgi:hypothetical protein
MTDTSNELLNAALNYAERGWPVLPLWPGKKTPLGKLVPNGHKDATTGEATIKQWWGRYPSANVGIRVGPESGLFVIDVESTEGHKEKAEQAHKQGKKFGIEALKELEEQHEQLPPTRLVQTATGGLHYYFTFPPEFTDALLNSQLAPGIDLKVKGYIVAPPSVIRDDCYAIVTEERL